MDILKYGSWVATALLMSLGGLVGGQEARELAFNAPETGEVVDVEGDVWSFLGSGNGVYSVLVEPLDSDLDPIVRLEDNRGRVLLENDDYDYPNSRSAQLEAFSIVNAGTYTIRVTGFGDTRGRYRLTLYNGYSDLVMNEDFSGGVGWDIFSAPEDEDLNISVRGFNGGARLSVEGIQQELGIRGGYVDLEADFYASVDISTIEHNNGWQVGILVRMEDEANFLAYMIDQRGYWRVFERRDGVDSIIRDWSSHPAIVAEAVTFRLSVLTYGDMLEVFYNDTFVGSVVTGSDGAGDVGLLVRTVNALNSDVAATFDNFLMTAPTLSTTPGGILRASGTTAIRNLQRQRLIAPHGALFLTLDEISIQNGQAGVRRFPLAGGGIFADFALGVEIDWLIDNTILAGCGLVFHDALERDAYGLVFVDNRGGYGIAERADDIFLTEFFQVDEGLGLPPYRVVVFFRDERLHVYINEVYRGAIDMRRTQGAIGTATVNYEPSLVTCSYRNLWVWKPD